MPAKLRVMPVPPHMLKPILAAGRRQKGEGWLGDALSTAWNGVKSVASKVKPSQLLGLVPHPGAQGIARVAGAVGLGRKKKTGGKRKTGGARKSKATGTMSGGGAKLGMMVM